MGLGVDGVLGVSMLMCSGVVPERYAAVFAIIQDSLHHDDTGDENFRRSALCWKASIHITICLTSYMIMRLRTFYNVIMLIISCAHYFTPWYDTRFWACATPPIRCLIPLLKMFVLRHSNSLSIIIDVNYMFSVTKRI